MKRFITFYYLLFVLLIMGAFSSMAQNHYGNTILGVVAFAFTASFLLQLITDREHGSALGNLELISMAIVSLVLGLRVFYIHFAGVEIMYGAAAVLLLAIRLVKAWHDWSTLQALNRKTALVVLTFHLSLAAFVLSIALAAFVPAMMQPVGVTAFSLMIVFLIAGYSVGSQVVEGERMSAFLVVTKWSDHSVVLAVLFCLFSLYSGFTRYHITPGMYSDEIPQAYFEISKGATGSNENQAEKFKAEFDTFIKHQQRSGK